MPVQKQPPIALALLVAESIHQDEVSQKSFILGTYSAIGCLYFPWAQPAIHCYAELTDGYGDTEVEFRLVDVDDVEEPLFTRTSVLHFPDPLHVAELAVRAEEVIFPEPGEYRLQLWAAGHLLLERRLRAISWQNDDG
jgi:hypothetical protein